MLALIKGCWA